jgi:hypothetical protein
MPDPTPDHPCIVIPGIEATGLENIYALPPAATWSTWQGVGQALGDVDFDSLALDDTAQVDDTETVVNRASQLLGVAYQGFVQALRGRSDLPVYVFPYDWRYSNVRSANKLVQFVRALQQKKLKSLPVNWDKSFDFACHSMGGLVLRQFLAAWRIAWPSEPLPVHRVVFIATPHLGSVDAVEAMIRGETSLFGGQKELRKLARTFPGVYELLPNPALPNTVIKDGAPVDFFNVNNWQQTVTPDPNDPDDFNVEQLHLTTAHDFMTKLPQVTQPGGELAGQVLVIYGSGGQTLRTVTVLPTFNGVTNWYDFDHAVNGEGDEVVPVDSAVLAGVPAFEVQKGDVSVFNLKSHVLSLHALLPSLDEVSSVTSRFFSGVAGAALLPKGTDPRRLHP